jgi:Domain of unknown function (DUF4157)
MEVSFGARFGTVRVHEGAGAARRGALALAVAEHLLLPPRLLRRGHDGWRYVLGHELAHVLQQRHGAAGGGPNEAALEREAVRAGLLAATGRPVRLCSIRGRRPHQRVAPRAIKLQLVTNNGVIDAAMLCGIIDGALNMLLSRNKNATIPSRPDRVYMMGNGKAWLDGLCMFGAYGNEKRPNPSLTPRTPFPVTTLEIPCK